MSFCLHSYCIHQILDSVSYAHQHDIVHRDLKVCVCVRACVCAFVLTLRAPVALHTLLLIAICLCLFFRLACACLSVSFFFPPARHQALHLELFLHCFGWSEAETRVLADIVLGCLCERLIKKQCY